VEVLGGRGVIDRIERGGGGRGSNKHHTQLYPLKYKFFNKKKYIFHQNKPKNTLLASFNYLSSKT